MSAEFDIQSFGRDPHDVARLVRAGDVFSFMNRQVTVPASCVVVVWGESDQPRVVPAGGSVDSREGAGELLFVRNAPFAMEYQFDGLNSKDDYAFSASVQLSVQVVADRTELMAFRRSLLGSRNGVRSDDLRRHCEEAARTALSAFAKARDAADLISANTWAAFDKTLVDHFKPVEFESGLALGRDPRVEFTSPAYAESRRATATAEQRRKRHEANEQFRAMSADAREKHLADLGTLLEQAKRMAEEQPGVAVADLIKTFDPVQRGALYEGLAALHQPVRRTEAILVAAGDELAWFDPENPSQPMRRQELTSDIGSLRSVRLAVDRDKTVLLVGARRGVHLVDPNHGLRQTCEFKTEAKLRGGVNAAALLGDHLYATHSEAGLIRWRRSQPVEHEACLENITAGAKAVRDVQADEVGHLWFSADYRVVCWAPDTDDSPVVLSAPSVVTTLLVSEGLVHAGLEDGRIVQWPTAVPDEMETLRGPTGCAVRSLGQSAGGGVLRLLIADGRPHLDLQVLGDSYLGEYRCNQKLRWGFAAEDWIIGVNDRRDQVLAWRLATPQQPTTTIPVGRILGHSIQDIALLPARESGSETA